MKGRIIAMLIGQPDSKDWDEVNVTAANVMVEVQQYCIFIQSGLTHYYGRYNALSTSISYSGGQHIPANLAHQKENHTEIDKLLRNSAIMCLAGFGSSESCHCTVSCY